MTEKKREQLRALQLVIEHANERIGEIREQLIKADEEDSSAVYLGFVNDDLIGVDENLARAIESRADYIFRSVKEQ